MLQKSSAGFTERKYPELCSFLAKRRLESLLRAAGKTAEADALLSEIARHAAAMASDKCFSSERARWYVTTVVQDTDLGWTAGALDEAGVEAVAANEAVDPWIRHMIRGLAHARVASHANYELESADKRREYFGHVREATQQLEAAHSLHPELPHAAVAMIVVAALEPGAKTPREWFERAVAACFDFWGAYANFLYVQHPDWGGSLGAMYRFGVECLATGRFDTNVPDVWLEVMRTAGDYAGSLRCPWASPDAATRLETFVTGIATAAQGSARASYVEALRPLAAWAGGRYEQAVAAWEAAGRKIDERWLRYWKVTKDEVVGELEALASGKPK